MTGRPRHRRRSAFALATMVLWILAVEVLPNVHLGTHDATTHTHAPAGPIVTVSFARADVDRDRDHEVAHALGATHDHAAAAPQPGALANELAISTAASHHAAAGLAHHATALLDPPAPLVEPLPIAPPMAWFVVATLRDLHDTTFTARPTARGPPLT